MAPGRRGRKPLHTTLGRAVKSSSPEEVPADMGIVGRPIHTSLFGLQEVLKMFQTGSEEVKNYARYECDIMYECRVCRNIFRSFANFVLHKRNYCRDNFQYEAENNNHKIICDDLRSVEVPEDKEEEEEVVERRSSKRLTAVEKAVDFELPDDLTKTKSDCLVIEKIADCDKGVFQSFVNEKKQKNEKGDLMKTEVMELQTLLDNNEVVLKPDGSVDNFETGKQLDSITSNKVVCQVCKLTFATKKTLSFHMKYKHNGNKVIFPCPDCKETFANTWGVFRHLYKVHRKTTMQIKRLRNQIHASAIKRKDEPVKKKAKSALESHIDENQQWIADFESSNDLQMCGGCGKRFERKAALHSHSVMCLKRSNVINKTDTNDKFTKNDKDEVLKEPVKATGSGKRKPKMVIRNISFDDDSSVELETKTDKTSSYDDNETTDDSNLSSGSSKEMGFIKIDDLNKTENTHIKVRYMQNDGASKSSGNIQIFSDCKIAHNDSPTDFTLALKDLKRKGSKSTLLDNITARLLKNVKNIEDNSNDSDCCIVDESNDFAEANLDMNAIDDIIGVKRTPEKTLDKNTNAELTNETSSAIRCIDFKTTEEKVTDSSNKQVEVVNKNEEIVKKIANTEFNDDNHIEITDEIIDLINSVDLNEDSSPNTSQTSQENKNESDANKGDTSKTDNSVEILKKYDVVVENFKKSISAIENAKENINIAEIEGNTHEKSTNVVNTNKNNNKDKDKVADNILKQILDGHSKKTTNDNLHEIEIIDESNEVVGSLTATSSQDVIDVDEINTENDRNTLTNNEVDNIISQETTVSIKTEVTDEQFEENASQNSTLNNSVAESIDIPIKIEHHEISEDVKFSLREYEEFAKNIVVDSEMEDTKENIPLIDQMTTDKEQTQENLGRNVESTSIDKEANKVQINMEKEFLGNYELAPNDSQNINTENTTDMDTGTEKVLLKIKNVNKLDKKESNLEKSSGKVSKKLKPKNKLKKALTGKKATKLPNDTLTKLIKEHTKDVTMKILKENESRASTSKETIKKTDKKVKKRVAKIKNPSKLDEQINKTRQMLCENSKNLESFKLLNNSDDEFDIESSQWLISEKTNKIISKLDAIIDENTQLLEEKKNTSKKSKEKIQKTKLKIPQKIENTSKIIKRIQDNFKIPSKSIEEEAKQDNVKVTTEISKEAVEKSDNKNETEIISKNSKKIEEKSDQMQDNAKVMSKINKGINEKVDMQNQPEIVTKTNKQLEEKVIKIQDNVKTQKSTKEILKKVKNKPNVSMDSTGITQNDNVLGNKLNMQKKTNKKETVLDKKIKTNKNEALSSKITNKPNDLMKAPEDCQNIIENMQKEPNKNEKLSNEKPKINKDNLVSSVTTNELNITQNILDNTADLHKNPNKNDKCENKETETIIPECSTSITNLENVLFMDNVEYDLETINDTTISMHYNEEAILQSNINTSTPSSPCLINTTDESLSAYFHVEYDERPTKIEPKNTNKKETIKKAIFEKDKMQIAQRKKKKTYKKVLEIYDFEEDNDLKNVTNVFLNRERYFGEFKKNKFIFPKRYTTAVKKSTNQIEQTNKNTNLKSINTSNKELIDNINHTIAIENEILEISDDSIIMDEENVITEKIVEMNVCEEIVRKNVEKMSKKLNDSPTSNIVNKSLLDITTNRNIDKIDSQVAINKNQNVKEDDQPSTGLKRKRNIEIELLESAKRKILGSSTPKEVTNRQEKKLGTLPKLPVTLKKNITSNKDVSIATTSSPKIEKKNSVDTLNTACLKTMKSRLSEDKIKNICNTIANFKSQYDMNKCIAINNTGKEFNKQMDNVLDQVDSISSMLQNIASTSTNSNILLNKEDVSSIKNKATKHEQSTAQNTADVKKSLTTKPDSNVLNKTLKYQVLSEKEYQLLCKKNSVKPKQDLNLTKQVTNVTSQETKLGENTLKFTKNELNRPKTPKLKPIIQNNESRSEKITKSELNTPKITKNEASVQKLSKNEPNLQTITKNAPKISNSELNMQKLTKNETTLPKFSKSVPNTPSKFTNSELSTPKIATSTKFTKKDVSFLDLKTKISKTNVVKTTPKVALLLEKGHKKTESEKVIKLIVQEAPSTPKKIELKREPVTVINSLLPSVDNKNNLGNFNMQLINKIIEHKRISGDNLTLNDNNQTEIALNESIGQVDIDLTLERKAADYIDMEKIICVACTMKFHSYDSLMKHMSNHFNWFNYQCSNCQFMSYDKATCLQHFRSKHDGAQMENGVINMPKWKTKQISCDFKRLTNFVPTGTTFPINEGLRATSPNVIVEKLPQISPPMQTKASFNGVLSNVFLNDESAKSLRPARKKPKMMNNDFVYDMMKPKNRVTKQVTSPNVKTYEKGKSSVVDKADSTTHGA